MSVPIEELRDYWRTCAPELPLSVAARLGVASELVGLVVRAPSVTSAPLWAVDANGVPWSVSACAVMFANDCHGVPVSLYAVGFDGRRVGVSAGFLTTARAARVLAPSWAWTDEHDSTACTVYLCSDVRTFLAVVARRYNAGNVGAVIGAVADEHLPALLECLPGGTILFCHAGDGSALRALHAKIRLGAAARFRDVRTRLYLSNVDPEIVAKPWFT